MKFAIKRFSVWLITLGLSVGSVVQADTSKADERKANAALADALFTNSTVLKLRLEISKEGIESLRKESHKYVDATLKEGDTVYSHIGVHLKGSMGSFRQVDDKPGLTLKMNTATSDYRFHGLKKWHLNNSVQDPSYVSEYICGEMYRKAGVPSPRVSLAVVELNGRKLGLYVVMESMDRDFLAQYFKNTKGNLYGQPRNADVNENIERMEGTGPLDWADLKSLAAAAQEPDNAIRWEKLQKKLDVDRFLSFMALEVMLCDWDGYTFARHNYRVYHDMDTDRFVFFPHDKDQELGNPNVPALHPGAGSLVSQAILKTPESRKKYEERVRDLYTNIFVVSNLNSLIDQRVAGALPALKAYDANIAREFQNHAENLKNRFVNRDRVLARQMNAPKPAKFKDGVLRIAGWTNQVNKGSASFQQVKVGETPALHIKCENGGCIAAWRTTVVLEPGRYKFSARVKCAGVVPEEGGAGGGGGIRNSLSKRVNKVTGDMDWTKVTHEFQVPMDRREVILVCDLRVKKGEIWYDSASMILEPVKN